MSRDRQAATPAGPNATLVWYDWEYRPSNVLSDVMLTSHLLDELDEEDAHATHST